MRIDEIREKYPSPIRACQYNGLPECYCVGGALCLAAGMDQPFPDSSEILQAAKVYNKSLSVCCSEEYATAKIMAERIVAQNDIGSFEKAWECLEELLTFHAQKR